MSPVTETITITITFLVIIFIALFIQGIKPVFGFIGATVSNVIAYILPGAFFLKACKMNPKET